LIEAAALSNVLLLGTVYKQSYLLTYLLTHWMSAAKEELIVGLVQGFMSANIPMEKLDNPQ